MALVQSQCSRTVAVTKFNQLLDNALMQDSTVMKNNVQKFDASNAMQIKAQSLETRVDKMMQGGIKFRLIHNKL